MVRTVLVFSILIPRNLVVVLLKIYRGVVSPLYGDVCRYYPSCSHYALHAIQELGVIRGVTFGAWRILRCNPWSPGGVDDPPVPTASKYQVTNSGFVISHSHGKG